MNSEQDNLCPICGTGQLRPQQIDYTITLDDGNKVTTPNLQVEICDHCGEIAIPAKSSTLIDKTIAEQTEQLSPQELEHIRDGLNVDQTEMSEILGLGGKTYHRWEKGNQVPSRSMGYYLRILAEFPEVFEWLRARTWRKQNRIVVRQTNSDLLEMFPDLPPTFNESGYVNIRSTLPSLALLVK
jgi:putative zinc finger/helix-turn-helix YgiT family protein